jgi:hypothetical protein
MTEATAVPIHDNAVYDDILLYSAMGVSSETLLRARRAGRLRFTRQGQRVLYLGRWVLDWLEADSVPTTGRAKEDEE